MVFEPKKYNIFVGDYGSGKTEISLNISKFIKKKYNNNVFHVDLDIVNPYFRSGEKKEDLEKLGINVIMPNFELTNVDIPSLPAEINKVFTSGCDYSVFDVGGDETGAAALGQFFNYFKRDKQDLETYMVINPFRPLTSTIEDTLLMINQIELRSRLNINKLINNSNVGSQTKVDDIIYGYNFVDKLAKLTGKTFAFSTGEEDLIKKLPTNISNNFFIIESYMKPEWL